MCFANNPCDPVISTSYGETYTNGIPPSAPNQGGASVKVSFRTDGVQIIHPYQLEMALDSAQNKLYYDLSSLNGDDFISTHRVLTFGGHDGCTELWMGPYDTSKEWTPAEAASFSCADGDGSNIQVFFSLC